MKICDTCKFRYLNSKSQCVACGLILTEVVLSRNDENQAAFVMLGSGDPIPVEEILEVNLPRQQKSKTKAKLELGIPALDLGSLKPGVKILCFVNIKVMDCQLSGSITVSVPWIKIAPSIIDTGQKDYLVRIEVDSSGLQRGLQHNGVLAVHIDEEKQTIPISLTITQSWWSNRTGRVIKKIAAILLVALIVLGVSALFNLAPVFISIYQFLKAHPAVISLGILMLVAVGSAIRAYKRGYRLSFFKYDQRHEPPSPIERATAYARRDSLTIEDLHESQFKQQDDLIRRFAKIRQDLESYYNNKATRQSFVGSLSGSSYSTRVEPVTSAYSDQHLVRAAYINLARGNKVSQEFIYLALSERYKNGKPLKDSKVLLKQVNNNKGTFVLFHDLNDTGWLFPNPSIIFRPKALRQVFPYLTEDEFLHFKENIKPVKASRQKNGLWRVEIDY